MPEFVRLVNRREVPFDFMANNRKRAIAPGGDTIVPWGLATSLFGDPRVVNSGSRTDRNTLYNKVRGRFNYALGMMTDEEWDLIAPQIDVFDLETDEQVFLVYHDPEGTRIGELEGQEINDQTEIAILKRQLAALSARLDMAVQQDMASAPTPAGSSTQALVTPSTDTAIVEDEALVGVPVPVDGGVVSPVVAPAAPSVDVPQTVPVGQDDPPSEPATLTRKTPAKK